MNISILDGRSYFYQWETDRVLVFDGVADGTEIHVNRGTECYRYYVADGQVAIDDFLLRECIPLRVYVIEDGAVTFEKAFKIVWKPRPDDYVDTPEEKQAWDEMSKRIDELSEQGGGAFYVTLTQDPTTLEYSSDKTYDEVKAAYDDNRNIICRAPIEEFIDVELSLLAHVEDDEFFIFIATDANFSYMAELVNADENTIALFHIEEETNEPLTLSIGGRTVVYDGKKSETIIVQSLKNPYSLTINGTAYDGSKAIEMELPEPLIGTTAEITPTQVQTALKEGRDISVTYTDETFGDMTFTSFVELPSFTFVGSMAIFMYSGDYFLVELYGMTRGNDWYFEFTQVLTPGDLESGVKNPEALTINGQSYDGSVAVDVETRDVIFEVNYYSSTDTYTTTVSAASIQTILDAGLNPVCLLNGKYFAGIRIPYVMGADGTYVFSIQPMPGTAAYVIINAGDFSAVEFLADITIGEQVYDFNGSVDFTDTINSMISTAAPTKKQGIYYIEGTGSTAGTWLGTHDDITEYYPGLTVLYKVPVAGASGGTTLNINDLGAATVVRNATTGISTTCPVNSVVMLTYTEDSGTAYWKTADYDSNTKTTTGTSNKAGTKLYLAGATSQSSSGATTYSNTNCYIGTNNRLYSGGAVVPNVDEINALISTALDAIGVAEEGAY